MKTQIYVKYLLSSRLVKPAIHHHARLIIVYGDTETKLTMKMVMIILINDLNSGDLTY